MRDGITTPIYPPSPASHLEVVIRGFETCDPTKRKDDTAQVSKAFLGALLEFDHMSGKEQQIVLQKIPLEAFLACYVVAIYWANKELGQWDHRVRYRKILTDTVRTKLDGVIGAYPRDDLLSKLKEFFESLGDWIDPTGPDRSRRASAACMGILRRLRVAKKLPPPAPMMHFGALASISPPVETKEMPVKEGEAPKRAPNTILTRSKLVKLRHREALMFYIDKYGVAETFEHPAVRQLVVDCKELVALHVPEERPPLNPRISSDDCDDLEDDDLHKVLSADDLKNPLTEEERVEMDTLFRRMGHMIKVHLEPQVLKYGPLPLPTWQQDPGSPVHKEDDEKSMYSMILDVFSHHEDDTVPQEPTVRPGPT
ncbi:hypothetical protein SISSUDRAFT_1131566 [Sistotremastrum suecicum HHB10207 ss-3]|uniref:Uncharacterized protein n=1 Tax=Sistotremastrum suecicum HHB10207 ss-3 TaxID=1314776 RepID=A0A166A0V5_9AGAM|nr:hypothetical protein SISSUDRAFT_1131566 [Sistotremastrum suecicum HHB10207 ss-3]